MTSRISDSVRELEREVPETIQAYKQSMNIQLERIGAESRRDGRQSPLV